MKISFVSNYYNHHQKEFCSSLYKIVEGSFSFISTIPMREERKKLGYGEVDIPEYVLESYSDEENKKAAQEDINSSDVVIIGSAPEQMIRKRIQEGKLVFRYSERPLKTGNSNWKYIPRFIRWHMRNPVNKPVYMLCASAYTSSDYKKYHLFCKKAYKWGYFPETIKYQDFGKILEQKDKQKILWCGRFLEWKHPESAIYVANRLKNAGYIFEVNLIGMGDRMEALQNMIKSANLEDCVHLLGTMKPTEVRKNMETAGIYLFTSNRKEGWGAVLNEAMNSGCAVVASHAIGSVPYLIKNNENGMIYKSEDNEQLFQKVKYLLDNPKEQEKFGRAAYETILGTWNADVAAERFVNLTEKILAGNKEPDLYNDGPCSKAEIIEDDWFYE